MGFLSFLLLIPAACNAASESAPPVERVANDPEARDAKELGELLLDQRGLARTSNRRSLSRCRASQEVSAL